MRLFPLLLVLGFTSGVSADPLGRAPTDATRVHVDTGKTFRDSEAREKSVLDLSGRYFSTRFDSPDMGLYAVQPALQDDLETLWRITQAGAEFGRADVDVGSWRTSPEYAGFFLYAANELRPRLLTHNYIGEPVLAPPMEKLLKPADLARLLGLEFDWSAYRKIRGRTPAKNQDREAFLIDALYATRSGQFLTEVRAMETYRKLRGWQKDALDREILLGQRFQQFLTDATIRLTIFRTNVPQSMDGLWSERISAAQERLPAGSIYRIVRNERGEVEGRIVLPLDSDEASPWSVAPDLAAMKARAALNLRPVAEAARLTRVPFPDGDTAEELLSDAHIRELVMAAGIGTRHAVKSAAARATAAGLQKVPDLLRGLKDRALLRNVALEARIRTLHRQILAMAKEQAAWVRTHGREVAENQRTLAAQLARIRDNPRFRGFLPRVLPSRSMLAAAGEIKASGGLPLATPMALAGIAAVLFLDISEARAAARVTPSEQEVGKKVARILVDAGIGVGLWLARTNPAGLAVWGGIAAAQVAQATLHPDIPTLTDATDLLSAAASDGYQSLQWALRRNQWLSRPLREWNTLRKQRFGEITSVDPNFDLGRLGADPNATFEGERNVYRLTPADFEKELGGLPRGAHEAEDRVVAAYAKGYLRLALAGLQYAAVRAPSYTPLAFRAYGCVTDDLRARAAIPKALSEEIHAFIRRVSALRATRAALILEPAELSEYLLRVAYELKFGGEVGDDRELHANPEYHPSADEREVAEILLRAWRTLQRD